MKINAEFDQRVVVHSAEEAWLESPISGVFRRPLDRVGAEIARATSIVKYHPNSHFSSHVHTGGEEFLVLEGVFQDEHGDYPVGSYVRNPPNSVHTPGSEDGCVIFVKLWQFDAQDRQHVNISAESEQGLFVSDNETKSMLLYQDEHEEVSVHYWAAGVTIKLDAENGIECLVLEGAFEESGEKLVQHSWLRLPIGHHLRAVAGDSGVRVWVKRNHLHRVNAQIKLVTQSN